MNARNPSHLYDDDTSRWVAVQTRDQAADEHFVYAVKTTGVYCRPSSSSRLPKRKNVVFYDTAHEAEAAGYRPSRRMGADRTSSARQHQALVAHACRQIENAETPLRLEQLAEQLNISPFHFHRLFKAQIGLTPKAYANAYRARRLRRELNEAGSITEAIYGAGFNSNSRFYDASTRMLGMQPRDYRAGGRNAQIHFAVGQCSLGAILVAQSQRGICAILLGDDADQLVRDLQDQFANAVLIGGDRGFEQLIAQVVGFVETPALGLNLPLDVRGTAFQERVWQALRDIPPGTTASYGQIAARIGLPKAVRAVARACSSNCIAVAIPCHRVIRRDGAVSGYRWGVERKLGLLLREKGHDQGEK